jgi:hypothetical protein
MNESIECQLVFVRTRPIEDITYGGNLVLITYLFSDYTLTQKLLDAV